MWQFSHINWQEKWLELQLNNTEIGNEHQDELWILNNILAVLKLYEGNYEYVRIDKNKREI